MKAPRRGFERVIRTEESSKSDPFKESTAPQSKPPYNFKGFDTRVSKEAGFTYRQKARRVPRGFNVKPQDQAPARRQAGGLRRRTPGSTGGWANAGFTGALLMEGHAAFGISGQDYSKRGTASVTAMPCSTITETRERLLPTCSSADTKIRPNSASNNSLLSRGRPSSGFELRLLRSTTRRCSASGRPSSGDFRERRPSDSSTSSSPAAKSKWGRNDRLSIHAPAPRLPGTGPGAPPPASNAFPPGLAREQQSRSAN